MTNPALFSPLDSTPETNWYLDSGASSHLTFDLSQFSTTEPFKGNSSVVLGNGQAIPIQHTGYQIKDMKTKQVLLQGPCHNGLYSIRSSIQPSKLALLSIQTVPDLWHNRLGHPDPSKLK